MFCYYRNATWDELIIAQGQFAGLVNVSAHQRQWRKPFEYLDAMGN